MNSTEIFTLGLGLKGLWEITDIEISVGKDSIKELHIYLVPTLLRGNEVTITDCLNTWHL